MFCIHCHQRQLSDETKSNMTDFYKNVFPILVEKGIPQASTFLKSSRCIRAFPNQFVIISGADCL